MEKAILMASGMGIRMRPLTNKTPKPPVWPVPAIPAIQRLRKTVPNLRLA